MNNLINNITKNSKNAFQILSNSKLETRNAAILNTAKLIKINKKKILEQNNKDLQKVGAKDLPKSFVDRLTLNESRIESMCKGLEEISKQNDPVGRILDNWKRPNGLSISKISVPLGIVGIIYESRPNVTIDAGSLCIKSGNAAILRGGSDSFNTSRYLTELLREGLKICGLPEDCVQFINTTDRKLVSDMLTAVDKIDIIIPRGGKSLVSKIQNEARVPVFSHLEGICHVYVDYEADLDKATKIIINSKMRRTGICGAAETLLLDGKLDNNFTKTIIHELKKLGCEIRAEKKIFHQFSDVILANESDWKTEYLDSIISIKFVNGVSDAINHINNYSSNHTDSIITENKITANCFLNKVDSAIVMHNASTQFADGGEFGMGAEIGISTGRLHARGPVGAYQLTSFKYLVRGSGQIRDN